MEKHQCRHGVPLRTSSIAFNEACPRCAEERAAYDRQTHAIGAQMPSRYRRGEFDRMPIDDHLAGTHDPVRERMFEVPPLSQEQRDMLEAGHGFVSGHLDHPFGRTSTERRVSRRIHKVRWALEYHPGMLTEAQRQAIAIVYGCVMPPRRAARALGISRQALRERLVEAEQTIDEEWEHATRRQRRWKKGRPDARLSDPEDAEWIEAKVEETLGREAASYVRPRHVRPLRPLPPEIEEAIRVDQAKGRLQGLRKYTAEALRRS